MPNSYDIIIVGGGPAGLTAAIYARCAEKSVLILEKNVFGGQIAQSPRVENFPGFLSISGAELSDKFFNQALELGNRTLMMDRGHIVLDLKGQERSGLTVEDLLRKFREQAKRSFNNDRILLSTVEGE